MTPTVTPIAQGLQVSWFDFTDDADVEQYQVFYGTSNPPTTQWGTVTGKFATLVGLTPGTTYYIQIFAVDCFGAGAGSAIVTGVPLALAADGGGSGSQPGPILLTTNFQTLVSVTVPTLAGATVFLWASALFTVGPASATTRLLRDGNEVHQGASIVPSGSIGHTGHLNGFDVPPAGTHTYEFQAKVDVGIPEASRRLMFLLIRQPAGG